MRSAASVSLRLTEGMAMRRISNVMASWAICWMVFIEMGFYSTWGFRLGFLLIFLKGYFILLLAKLRYSRSFACAKVRNFLEMNKKRCYVLCLSPCLPFCSPLSMRMYSVILGLRLYPRFFHLKNACSFSFFLLVLPIFRRSSSIFNTRYVMAQKSDEVRK